MALDWVLDWACDWTFNAPADGVLTGDFDMTDVPENAKTARRSLGLWPLLGLAAVAVLSVLYLQDRDKGKTSPVPPSALQAAAIGEMAAFTAHAQPVAVPAVTFKDADGKDHTLAEWQGKVLLLNLWATWCAPCRHEMPALDALRSQMGGKDFDVVALATDRGGLDKPKKFWSDAGIRSLGLYLDAGDATHGLGVIGMPTTLLIGRDGRELGRLVGPAEWGSAEAKALIAAALKG